MPQSPCNTCNSYAAEFTGYSRRLLAGDSGSVADLINVMGLMLNEKGSACPDPGQFCLYVEGNRKRFSDFRTVLQAAEDRQAAKDKAQRDQEVCETLAEYVQLRRGQSL